MSSSDIGVDECLVCPLLTFLIAIRFASKMLSSDTDMDDHASLNTLLSCGIHFHTVSKVESLEVDAAFTSNAVA